MNYQQILQKYVSDCAANLLETGKILNFLKTIGIRESYLFDTFRIGYSSGALATLVKGNKELETKLEHLGLVKKGKEVLANHIIIPIMDSQKEIVNILAYNPYPRTVKRITALNRKGLFNKGYLNNCESMIITDNPLHSLLLIQSGYSHSTFFYYNDKDIVEHFKNGKTREAVFAFVEGKELFYQLTTQGYAVKRLVVDFDKLKKGPAKAYLEKLFEENTEDDYCEDKVKKIENGFLFHLTTLSYRVIGNFSEFTLHMKANIKAFTESDVFVDMVDLYKNRDRNNFIFNLMDKFEIRDQMLLERDLDFILKVIENHKENNSREKKNEKVQLTDFEKEIGLGFLKNPALIDEIDKDITELGYVRERKNKILLYMVMVSRLMDNPLHSVVISRSSAGKSQLVDIIETLCPPEQLESISDLSAQAMYYYNENDLKNKYIVIGEREGSESADYPIRELISKKSIVKAIPMKDPVTGQIRTEKRRVNGPIAYTETTTSLVNEENLSRYFVLGVDESEEQTRLIHEQQRQRTTIEGYLKSKQRDKIREKHIYAGRLLKPIKVFNPYANHLKFPSGKLKSRRDHQKFLRLINVVCFIHQYQRKTKKVNLDSGELLEYIECTLKDYEIAFDLLRDGILDNTLDDIPRQAKELLGHIRSFLEARSKEEDAPCKKIIFTRKEIREYTNWTFVQIRNNFRLLSDYEYITKLPEKKITAHQYKISDSYFDQKDINAHILTPEELEKQIKNQTA